MDLQPRFDPQDNQLTPNKGEYLALIDAYHRVGRVLGKKPIQTTKTKLSLGGIWKSINFSQEEISQAQKDLFK